MDVLQTPAFLCRQTNFITKVCSQGIPVNIKKGQFLAPSEMKNVVKKASACGNEKIMVCERGFSFGYNNLVVDTLNFQILKGLSKPVIFDVTHSLQLPGGLGSATGGRREYLLSLAKAGVSQSIAGLFLEAHPDPDNAAVDPLQPINYSDFGSGGIYIVC